VSKSYFSGYKNEKFGETKKNKINPTPQPPPKKTTTGLDIVFRMG
jgi:hypothetical protein